MWGEAPLRIFLFFIKKHHLISSDRPFKIHEKGQNVLCTRVVEHKEMISEWTVDIRVDLAFTRNSDGSAPGRQLGRRREMPSRTVDSGWTSSRTMLESGVSDIGAVVGSYSAAHRVTVEDSVELRYICCPSARVGARRRDQGISSCRVNQARVALTGRIRCP